MSYPDSIQTVAQLEDLLSDPTEGVIETLGRLEGDLIVLGAGGTYPSELCGRTVLKCRRQRSMSTFASSNVSNHSRARSTVAIAMGRNKEIWPRKRLNSRKRCKRNGLRLMCGPNAVCSKSYV